VKYAVIKLSRLNSGQIFISPTDVFDALPISKDRAVFGADAYHEDYVVVELRPVFTVKSQGRKGVTAQ
jgi:hypothetical protein